MNFVERAAAKLLPYPSIRYERRADSITVKPENSAGFTVDLRVGPEGFTVGFDGWHEEFSSEDEAISCFRFGLTSACRLAVTYRGSFPCKWGVESKQGDEWFPDSETGLLIFPFWRTKRIVHLQNHVLTCE